MRQEPRPIDELGPAIAAAPGLRVLLLGDDPFMLALLRRMLIELGASEVLCESSARRALTTLAARAPDLLVCDLALAHMDGSAFLQAVAGDGYRGGVILLSGAGGAVRTAAARLATACGLRLMGAFCKPVNGEQLRGALVPLLHANHLRGAG